MLRPYSKNSLFKLHFSYCMINPIFYSVIVPTVTGTGTAFLSEVAVGDLILFTGNGDEKIVTAIASDTSLTVHSGMLLAATASAFTIRKKVSMNNGVLTLGTSSVTPLIAGSGVFAGAYPKVDINTGNNTWQTYSDVMVMRHSGTGATANTRQLGFLFKLSNESSTGESQKSGGIMLESTTSYANNPNLSLVTTGSKRLTIDYLGNVAIGTTPVTTSRFTVSTTATSGSIANFVSTGAGGAGCSITWNGTSCSSDERLKENITNLTSPLEDVLKLRSVNFNWKKDQKKERQIGYVAQEVEKVIPEVVRNDSNGYKQVNYGNIVSIATAAIQEFFLKWQDDSAKLHREIATLKEENELKNQEIELLKSRLDNLEKKSKN
ncbi:hypothetical protein C0V70_04355 [Bacteriovorax stolpii]|uniref:Uncharacterized protein n=2 Tax=Bacteriovorax stolpii TaxID=960 RepID=A0A2K9NRH6_BACTC|nr:hypothetical protein C0V70_04355 [Bacteriovorax stolpii]TDP52525.1 endosialidase-like protein [Bacteriovorax stolpii]